MYSRSAIVSSTVQIGYLKALAGLMVVVVAYLCLVGTLLMAAAGEAPHPNSYLPAEISLGRDCSGGKLMENFFNRFISNL